MKTRLQSYESMLKNAVTKKDKEIAKLLLKGERMRLKNLEKRWKWS